MSYDPELADRVRFLLGDAKPVEKRMFGGLAFLLSGHLAVAASSAGGLLVRVAPEQADLLIGERGVAAAEMGGRRMRGWLRVSPEVLDDDDALKAWVARSVGYVKTLPPK